MSEQKVTLGMLDARTLTLMADVRDVQLRMGGIEARLGALESRFSAFEAGGLAGRMTALESRFAAQEERIARMMDLLVRIGHRCSARRLADRRAGWPATASGAMPAASE